MRGFQHKRMRRIRTWALCLGVAVLAVGAIGVSFFWGNDPGVAGPRPSPVQAGADESQWETVEPTPSYTLTTETPGPEQPPNMPPPKKALPPAAGYQGPPAKNPAEAVAHAVSVGRSRGEKVAAEVLDRRTGAMYGAGDVDYGFASASVVKAFIATRLLADGKSGAPGVADQMWRMIVASDDKAATALYPLVGREDVVPWVASRYHLSGLAPANVPNYWGLTRITAKAMVNFYDAVAEDPVVGPWLTDAMAHAQGTAADGFPQLFGIPAVAHSWKVKQGWMCCLESVTRMHSTGFVDGDRYTVALLTEGPKSVYGSFGAQTLTLMAQALLPGGTMPQPAAPPPPADPKPTTPPPVTTPTESAAPTSKAAAQAG